MNHATKPVYRGRFAPSPSGPLHFGSLVSAVASYVDARHMRGEWLLRIEDIDPPREVPGSDKLIIETLEQFGFEWDGPIVWQSKRSDLYEQAIQHLHKSHLIYNCSCTRKSIIAHGLRGKTGMLYPGTCRDSAHSFKQGNAVRLKVDNTNTCFVDRVHGKQCQILDQDVGDFILRRSDLLWAYQLAVVVDDAEQNITHVVRGADLLDLTQRQIFLQQKLGYTTPDYIHHTLILNEEQTKLSKQTGAPALNRKNPAAMLYQALNFLGQNPPIELEHSDLPSLWKWAITHWNVESISKEHKTLIL